VDATSIYIYSSNYAKSLSDPTQPNSVKPIMGQPAPATYIHVYVMDAVYPHCLITSRVHVFVVSFTSIQCKEARDIAVYLKPSRIMHSN